MNTTHQKTEVPLTSIVVASYDRPAFLLLALDSIVAQSYPNLEIIVVDNPSSSSDEISRIVGRYDRVRLVKNSENLGFTGAMNRGIDEASGVYVYFTLDDVVLDSDCILRLVERAEENLGDGLLSGILMNDDRETIRCAGGIYSLTPVFRRTILGAGEKDAGQFSEPYQINYVPGGMIFARLDLMRRLNGFRKQFFMYSEDTDLCARVIKAGWKISVVPRCRAYVTDAPHGFTQDGIAFHKFKNFFSVYLLHARVSVLPEFYLRYGVISFLRALVSDRKKVWPMTRAWAWFLLNAPAMLKERYRGVSGQYTCGSEWVKEAKMRVNNFIK